MYVHINQLTKTSKKHLCTLPVHPASMASNRRWRSVLHWCTFLPKPRRHDPSRHRKQWWVPLSLGMPWESWDATWQFSIRQLDWPCLTVKDRFPSSVCYIGCIWLSLMTGTTGCDLWTCWKFHWPSKHGPRIHREEYIHTQKYNHALQNRYAPHSIHIKCACIT